MPKRGLAFVAIVLGCLLLGGGWVLVSSRNASTTSTAQVQLASDGPAETQSSSGAPVKLGGELLVRSVDPKDPRLNGPVARVAVGAGKQAGDTGRLACQRVYMAAGAGLCLALAPSGVEYRARIFDRRYHVRHELTLSGLPSRARVSPGRPLGRGHRPSRPAIRTRLPGSSRHGPGSSTCAPGAGRPTSSASRR